MSDISYSEPTSNWRQDRVLWLIIGLALVLGLIYNNAILIGFGPDEPRHMNYVKLVFSEHSLPYLLPGSETEYRGAHAYHPPLYYLLLLPVYALGRSLGEPAVWHLARSVSLLLCLATLPLVYQIAQRAYGYSFGGQTFARLVVAQVALLPIFGMTSGIINNDSALLFTVVLFLWLLGVKYSHEWSWKSAVIIGICFGAGALCKATALLCNGAALIFYLLAQFNLQNKGSSSYHFWLRQVIRLGLILVVAAIVAGPWYFRNLQLYGTFQPIPVGFAPSDLGWLPRRQYGVFIALLHPHFPSLLGQASWGIFYSLWSQKDWFPESWRTTIYVLFVSYSFAALSGFVRNKWLLQRTVVQLSPEKCLLDRDARPARWSAYAAFIVSGLACLQIALFVHWGQAEGGRYLLPAFVGFSIFLARGWQKLLGNNEAGVLRLKWLTLIWCVFALSLNVLSIYWLHIYLNPLALKN